MAAFGRATANFRANRLHSKSLKWILHICNVSQSGHSILYRQTDRHAQFNAHRAHHMLRGIAWDTSIIRFFTNSENIRCTVMSIPVKIQLLRPSMFEYYRVSSSRDLSSQHPSLEWACLHQSIRSRIQLDLFSSTHIRTHAYTCRIYCTGDDDTHHVLIHVIDRRIVRSIKIPLMWILAARKDYAQNTMRRYLHSIYLIWMPVTVTEYCRLLLTSLHCLHCEWHSLLISPI